LVLDTFTSVACFGRRLKKALETDPTNAPIRAMFSALNRAFSVAF